MKYIFLCLAVVITKTSRAQSLTNFIPANTGFVFSMNLGQLNAKSNQLDYTQYLTPFIKQNNYNFLDEANTIDCNVISLKKVLQSPADYGLDLKNNLYVYNVWSNDYSGTVYLLPLADAKKFESKLQFNCSSTKLTNTLSLVNGKLFVSDETSVCFNEKSAVIFIKNYKYNYYNDYTIGVAKDALPPEEYEEAPQEISVDTTVSEATPIEEGDGAVETITEISPPSISYESTEGYKMDSTIIKEREKQAKLLLESIADFLEKCLISQTDNFTSNRNFQKLNTEQHDAFFYLNTSSLISAFPRSPSYMTYYPPLSALTHDMGSNTLLNTEMNASYTIDFDNGKATVKLISNYSPKSFAYIENCYDAKQSKKLLKYIDGRNLLGYFSYALNAKEMVKLYEVLYKDLLHNNQATQYSRNIFDANIINALELMYAFIDKEMLYNSIKTQMIFACTGFDDIHMKYTTYEYDDNFERKEKITESVVKQPKLVMAAALGNKTNAKKLFDIISKFTIFTKVKENVFAFYANGNMRMNVYFALTDDAFIITNDADLVLNNLKGYSKQQQMEKVEKTNILAHNMTGKIFSQPLLKGINEAYFSKGQPLPIFAKMMTQLSNVEMYSFQPKDNMVGMTATLNLKDNTQNALFQLLQMMTNANER